MHFCRTQEDFMTRHTFEPSHVEAAAHGRSVRMSLGSLWHLRPGSSAEAAAAAAVPGHDASASL